jgi:hypothetical protein
MSKQEKPIKSGVASMTTDPASGLKNPNKTQQIMNSETDISGIPTIEDNAKEGGPLFRKNLKGE